MYYPKNFPRHLEKSVITLLHFLEEDFIKRPPGDMKAFNRLLLDRLKKPDLQLRFKGKKPSLWWLKFVLMRHENKFTRKFRTAVDGFLMKTKTRSISGVVAMSLFTAGKGCPFSCVYCPNEPGVPKSYFSDEPAVMRAIRHSFDPFQQTLQRLVMFALSGHPLDKIEVIIKGGTFSFYPKKYRRWFVKRIFDAANCDVVSYIKTGRLLKQSSSTLTLAQATNETAKNRVIGINVETRPDYVNRGEIRFLRDLGVTHVEMGVQALDDAIYRLIQRGHTVKDVADSTRLLKNAGFKVGYHLMPNLPGSNPGHDFDLLKMAFEHDGFKPDHLKLYPTTVTKHTVLARWFKDGVYAPYSTDQLIEMIARFKSEIAPVWVRIGRLTRDITTDAMEGEGIAPNTREVIRAYMDSHGLKCSCIRCREIRDRRQEGKILFRSIEYGASGGSEYFLEYVDEAFHSLGFLRLRLPRKTEPDTPDLLKEKALVRELHVYGQAVPLGARDEKRTQHKKIGASLMVQAEKTAKTGGLKGIAVIAGVGTRDYYRKFGYRLKDTYMVKGL